VAVLLLAGAYWIGSIQCEVIESPLAAPSICDDWFQLPEFQHEAVVVAALEQQSLNGDCVAAHATAFARVVSGACTLEQRERELAVARLYAEARERCP
jgi:hypothetical protein